MITVTTILMCATDTEHVLEKMRVVATVDIIKMIVLAGRVVGFYIPI
ncbi:MAG: hypothetical protein ACTSUE_14050 [Promethearchaeota archaeon]